MSSKQSVKVEEADVEIVGTRKLTEGEQKFRKKERRRNFDAFYLEYLNERLAQKNNQHKWINTHF